MAEAKSLTTKRLVMGQVLVCQGCCCGAVERGRPEVPTEWLKAEWRRRGLLKQIQLTISGCLGPETSAHWYGNVASREMYRDILDWASDSVAANCLLEVPKSFAGHSIEPFRKDVARA